LSFGDNCENVDTTELCDGLECRNGEAKWKQDPDSGKSECTRHGHECELARDCCSDFCDTSTSPSRCGQCLTEDSDEKCTENRHCCGQRKCNVAMGNCYIPDPRMLPDAILV
jgi:hypothetical protein